MPNGGQVAAVVVAAGASRRMGFDKLLFPIAGVPVLRRAVHAFDRHPGIDTLVVVAGENLPAVRALFEAFPTQKPLVVVPGGATRTHSVAAGVRAAGDADYVAIHDGARPFVGGAVITRTLEAARETGAAAPAVPVVDTVKRAENGLVAETPPRRELYAVQTPQVFERNAFLAALAVVDEADYPGLTDDCMVMERAHRPVRLVEGEVENVKITNPADLPGQSSPTVRVGHGYDVHRLVAGRRLILGGVDIPYEKGLLGHSDADVLLHAVADALLGAAALGDIGRHFPDSDPSYKDADSQKLLAQVAALVCGAGWAPANIDATVVCQAPKLAPFIEAMRKNIAAACGLVVDAVNVKATTEEHLGFTGEGQGIAAHCVALVAGGG